MNAMLKKILTAWCEFLSSRDSLYVLNDSPPAGRARSPATVGIEQFEHDPEDEYWGFESWNDFFTRRFKEGDVRSPRPRTTRSSSAPASRPPTGSAPTSSARIASGSRASPIRSGHAGQRRVGRPVRWRHRLSGVPERDQLPPLAQPRRRDDRAAFVQDGTYYSEADSEGADAAEPTISQSYLAHVAARAIILIQADDPVIGLMAVIPVGMIAGLVVHDRLER